MYVPFSIPKEKDPFLSISSRFLYGKTVLSDERIAMRNAP